MSKINYDNIINERRSGEPDDPFVLIIESKKITNNKILLTEIPDYFNKVKITGYNERFDSAVTATQFYVDYSIGLVTFDSTVNGTTVSVQYYGTGIIYWPASRIWVTEENDDITETLQDLIDTIENLEILGVWDSSTTYSLYNIVSDATFSYISLQNNNLNKQPDLYSDYWLCLSSMVNFQHRGTWSSATAYYKNNLVTYNSSSYMCVVDNTNKIPSTETSYWKLVALCGSVVSVTSANADISVATGTSTPVLTLNSGASASQIVKRDASANIPTDSILFGGNFKMSFNTGGNCLDIEYVGT